MNNPLEKTSIQNQMNKVSEFILHIFYVAFVK